MCSKIIIAILLISGQFNSRPTTPEDDKNRQTDASHNSNDIIRQIQFVIPQQHKFVIGVQHFDGVVRYRAFDSAELEQAIKYIERFSRKVEAIWLLGGTVAENHPRTQPTCDENIDHRCTILIDLDVVKRPDISATDVEHKAACDCVSKVVNYLIDIWAPMDDGEHFPFPMINDSGNGCQLLIPADLRNDAATNDLVKNFLYAISRRFPNDGTTKIDVSVSNASRFVKLCGTYACKGPNTADRPHRMAKILLAPDEFLAPGARPTPVTREMLLAVIADNPIEFKPKPAATDSAYVQPPKHDNLRPFHEYLGEKERHFLQYGDDAADQSVKIQGVANSAINHHASKEQFSQAMFDSNNKGARKVLELLARKGVKAAEAWVERTWNSALRFIRENPSFSNRDDVRQQIQAMRSAVNSMPWPDVSGATDLAVLNFHLDLAYRLGSLIYDRSSRSIAEAVHMGRPTVSKSHGRLSKFIACIGHNSSQTATWQLKLHVQNDVDRSSIYLRGREEYWIDQRHSQAHDVWEHRALGKGRWHTWKALDVEQGITVVKLSQRLSRPTRTITAHLKKLVKYGLARSMEKTWYRVERDLDEVAKVLGTLGRGKKRTQQHELEREGHQWLKPQKYNNANGNLQLINEATGERINPSWDRSTKETVKDDAVDEEKFMRAFRERNDRIVEMVNLMN